MASAFPESELEELSSGLGSCRIDDNDKSKIEHRLAFLDIPFNWNPQQSRPEGDNPKLVVADFKRKLKELRDTETQLEFKSFCCYLTLAQELIKYDTESALKNVLECETWMDSLKTGTCKEKDFLSISEAINYIYLGSKAFALFKCGFVAKAKELLSEIPELVAMEDKQRSGIYGVKAWTFMEYGVAGFFKALECISVARTKHPAMAEWHFLTGKIMSRIRHVKFPFMVVSDEEENFYRTAYKLNPENAGYTLYIAQITREKSFGLFQECRYDREQHREALERVDKMNAEALSLYMRLLGTHKNDSHILGRTAFGMVKLPEPYKRIDLAVQAIEEALHLTSDNPLINHYAGLIYYRYVQDNIKGLIYLERAARQRNIPALMDWIKLKCTVDPHYDPIPDWTKALQHEDYNSSILTEMASWYFFKKDNVFRAWDHLKKVTEDHFAKSHKCGSLRMKHPCNLFEVIFDEVKLLLAKQNFRNQQEKEELMSISNELQKICPDSHPTDYSNYKAIILDESERTMRYEQGRLYRRGGGRGGARNGGGSSHARGSTRNFEDDRGDSTYMRGHSSYPRGRSNNRGSSTNVRRGSNDRGGFSNSRSGCSRGNIDANPDKSASQTGLNIVLGEEPQNLGRDTRSRDREKSNRGKGGSNRSRDACTHKNIQSEGNNTDKSASQTGLNIVLDDETQNARRDTRSRDRGKSKRDRGAPNRSRAESCQKNIPAESEEGAHRNNPVVESVVSEKVDNSRIPDLDRIAGGISLKDVLKEKLLGLNSDFKNNLNVKNNLGSGGEKLETSGGENLPEAVSSRKNVTNRNKPKHRYQSKRSNENDSRKYNNLGNIDNFVSNVCEKSVAESNNNYLETSSTDKTSTKNFFVKKQPRQLCSNSGEARAGPSNVFGGVKHDNFSEKPSNLDKGTNDLNATNVSENVRNLRPRKDTRPVYYPKKGTQASNFTTNKF
ncbi:uncharacterized protein LOC111064175 isoform X3 [Nilaparvata lugens]|uniref:uncharacterized protein LOC111064175 isoform X2 n=1 Tax=Nilaparvata lugens TaxID=108931 RepID=UPI00193CC867|nr:uncharacterized protein LOC111064175 isoform X2 [Nilaparvata lugens]XP_039284589.1 uncharacterized protein LOC111064175 isoform X3 [Nilaparvata lugens]